MLTWEKALNHLGRQNVLFLKFSVNFVISWQVVIFFFLYQRFPQPVIVMQAETILWMFSVIATVEMDQHLKMLGQTFFKFPFDLVNELPFLPYA